MTEISVPKTTQTQEMRFKHKALEERIRPDGEPSYKETVYPPYGDGWSKYPIELFLRGGSKQPALVKSLARIPEGEVINLVIERGKLKQGKEDDGHFGSYFWNAVDFLAVAAPQVPESPQAATAITPWDETQARIGASWAIGQATQVILAWHQGPHPGGWSAEAWGVLQREIQQLAPHFLALRDDLTMQQAQEGLPEAPHSTPEAVAVSLDTQPPQDAEFKARLGRFFGWAKEKHSLEPEQALAAAGLTMEQVTEKLDLRWVAAKVMKAKALKEPE